MNLFRSRSFAILALFATALAGVAYGAESAALFFLCANLLALGASGRFRPSLGVDLSITPGSVVKGANSTVRNEYTFAATVTAGQVVYLNASNQWALADQNAGLGTATTSTLGVALNGGAINQPAQVDVLDLTGLTIGATVTNGTSYYLSDTAGGITAVLPTTGDYPVFLGLGSGTTLLVLNPTRTGVII